MEHPSINVTPLIDILLVLLIVFMVVAPLKPSAFKVRLPAEEKNATNAPADPQTLVVSVNDDLSIDLNGEKGLATVEDPSGLVTRLRQVFELREKGQLTPIDQSHGERTVFIRARKSLGYGHVARAVDAVKLAGAFPISLQIDHLD